MMSVKRIIMPIVLGLTVISAHAAMSDFQDNTRSLTLSKDPASQIDSQIEIMVHQNELLSASLEQLPLTAVEGPDLIHELEVDGKGLKVASLKVEESILETLKQIDGQYENAIPSEKLTVAYLRNLPNPSGDGEFKCLAQALYFEARGENIAGQQAVAEVILNRVRSGKYPNTICGVVNQGTGKKHQCQFSYTCDGHPEVIREKGAYTQVSKLARLMIDGLYDKKQVTGGALFYHTTAVHPSWANRKTPTAKFGVHIFYR